MNRYLVQMPQPDRALVLDLWELIEAEDARHAAAIVAARWGPGTREVFVSGAGDPTQPNGMPICVHGIECIVVKRR